LTLEDDKSITNLLCVRSFAESWTDEQIVQQAVGQLPWGLLLCKNKNEIVAEYVLSNQTQLMGIAEFKLLESLPVSLQTQLPSMEDIERELEEKQNG
jgi:hypothetical protein